MAHWRKASRILAASLATVQPLIDSISLVQEGDAKFEPIAESLDPVLLIRIGSVSASAFVNEAKGKQPFRFVSLQRRYKDGDQWKSSGSFNLRHLPATNTVLQMATTYVAEREAESGDAASALALVDEEPELNV